MNTEEAKFSILDYNSSKTSRRKNIVSGKEINILSTDEKSQVFTEKNNGGAG